MRIFSRTTVLALMAMLGIFLVFFFPATCGPFSVTNGPATAFRALQAARGLFAAMSAALLVAILQCILYLQFIMQGARPVNCDPALVALRC